MIHVFYMYAVLYNIVSSLFLYLIQIPSEAEIKQFLGAATANDLIVIPLVQTFGHLEVNINIIIIYIFNNF